MAERIAKKNAMSRNAVIFLAWGDHYIQEVAQCLARSDLSNYDKFLITEEEFGGAQLKEVSVISAKFKTEGFIRKSEMINYIPEGYDSYLFLDSDTVVLGDISLGFEKAKQYGIALSPEPHYCLDRYFNFGKILKKESIKCAGQLQYNTGVIFFRLDHKVKEVFQKWHLFAGKYFPEFNNDQPYFSMALEYCFFNPYTLSINYNYRGTGEHISGDVRIWHSHYPMPKQINDAKDLWPMRSVYHGCLKIPPKRNYWVEWNHYLRNWVKCLLAKFC